MEIIWQSEPQTAAAIRGKLDSTTGWALGTVNTLLRRLADKGVLRTEKRGREFLYFSLVGRDACALHESRSLVDRVFGGQLAPLVAAFVGCESISGAELEEIRVLLKKARAAR